MEPVTGRAKNGSHMDRCWLKGQTGDVIHTVLCAAGYNPRWLMRAVARPGWLRPFYT